MTSSREKALDTLEMALIRIGRQFRHKMPSEDLTWTQMVLLRELYRRERLAMGDVAHTLGVSGAAATSAIDRLVRDGWVVRIRSEDDRRQVWVALTPAAHERMATLQAERRRHLARLVAPLSEDELATLVRLLARIADAIPSESSPSESSPELAGDPQKPFTQPEP